METISDTVKARQLRKHKTIATGLFILMVAIYILTTLLMKTRQDIWLGYVKAFSEAAMVGALADWFAVTALFHHPLGIPIPHTNLIENKKKSIGDNLGGFVVDNFLNPSTIRPYIQKLNLSSLIIKWMSGSKNAELLSIEIAKLLKDVVQNADDATVINFIANKSNELLNDVQLNEALASALDIVIERGDQVRILNYVIKKIKQYVHENETVVRDRVKKESHFLVPGFVDNIIAAKITNGVTKYLSEIENDPDHKIRSDINEQLKKFIRDVSENPKWQQELQQIKDSILKGDKVQQYAKSVWKHLQKSIVDDLDGKQSAIESYIAKTIREMVFNLQNDTTMQQKIDNWARQNAYKYILRNTQKAGDLISNTVGNWKGKELSNKLELEVGKDLQFIRINGTLVGGLMGVLIHALSLLFL